MSGERHLIRLPASSPRGTRNCYVKLLRAVSAEARDGFGFEGVFLRPGRLVTFDQLRPGPEFPPVPVLLELSFAEARGIIGNRRRDSVYTLWRFDTDVGHFAPLAVNVAQSWEWAIELRPLALRAIAESWASLKQQTTPRTRAANIPAIMGKLAGFIDSRLRTLDAADRARVLAQLHDEIAAHICA